MRHEIPIDELGPHGAPMAAAVSSCVHCGFCLPTCPTYVAMGEEMDSPRGRIILMKEVLEGKLELELAIPYIDNCLGCQACETACPSGVKYGDLLTPFRSYAETRRERPRAQRLQRALVLRTLPSPRRFRLAVRSGALARPFARLLPSALRPMLELLPRSVPAAAPLPAVVPAQGERRARVALLRGCVQQTLSPAINWATVRVLSRNGVEVVIPREQGCCGALAMHTGAMAMAKPLARTNLAAFPRDVDAVLTNAAGCGSGMKEYGLLFAGDPEEDAAHELAGRTMDVSKFLADLGLRETPPPLPEPLTVAYQDACHLAHAQRIRSQPRALLGAIEGVTVVEPGGWQLCCGSAGTYNLEKPDLAAQLGREKATALLATGAQLVASGNIGCLTQLSTHLQALGQPLPTLHTFEVLDRAYSGSLRGSGAGPN